MELVKTINFDEFMQEYYELNDTNNVDVDKSLTENDYEVDKESGIITRRDFLKYSALGTATLIMGASTEKAEAFFPLIIGAIALGATAWASSEDIVWEIRVGNPSHTETLHERGDFELIGEEDFIDGENYANGSFSVPPRKARVYRNTSLRANVTRDTKAFIKTYFHTSNTHRKSSSFTIKS